MTTRVSLKIIWDRDKPSLETQSQVLFSKRNTGYQVYYHSKRICSDLQNGKRCRDILYQKRKNGIKEIRFESRLSQEIITKRIVIIKRLDAHICDRTAEELRLRWKESINGF